MPRGCFEDILNTTEHEISLEDSQLTSISIPLHLSIYQLTTKSHILFVIYVG